MCGASGAPTSALLVYRVRASQADQIRLRPTRALSRSVTKHGGFLERGCLALLPTQPYVNLVYRARSRSNVREEAADGLRDLTAPESILLRVVPERDPESAWSGLDREQRQPSDSLTQPSAC